MSEYLLLILCLSYSGMMLFFIAGVSHIKSNRRKDTPLHGVSVIVPLHNEEKDLFETLEALANQKYEGPWEVICVNDRSTDSTPQLLQEFCSQHERFSLCEIPMDAEDLPSPKKRALEVGFSHAKYDILLTMDADCFPPSGWVNSMAQNFHSNIEIVQGPKKIRGGNNLLHNFQKIETLGLTLIEAAGFSMKRPALASAAALGYTKNLFYRVGGFRDLMQYTSGDDDMLVHKMVQEDIDYCYNLDAEAQVETAPVDTWKGLINQRARWSSNGTNYSSKTYTMMLTLIYVYFCWLLLSPFLWVSGLIPFWWFAGPYLIKVSLDFAFLYTGAPKLASKDLLKHFLPSLIIQIPLIVISVPLGQLKLYKW